MFTWHPTSPLKKAIAALGLAAAAVIAQPAMAGNNHVVTHVSYADLELTSAEGQAELQRRVDKAAVKVCRFDAKGRLNTAKHEIACYREVRQKVSVQVASIIRDTMLGG